MKQIILAILLLIQASALATAQSDASGGAVTLDGLLGEVLRNNPRLLAAKERARAEGARAPQATAWDDPVAGVEFHATPVTSANPFRDGMETDYFLEQMIPWPGKKGRMGDAADASARASVEEARAVERDLVLETKRAYAMIWSAQQRIEVNVVNQALVRQLIESARSRYRVGSVIQGDVLKAQVEGAKLENERSVLDQELASALAEMNALRDSPAVAMIGRVANPEPAQVDLSPDTLEAMALASRPELGALARGLDRDAAELAVAEKEWYPDITLRGIYKSMVDQTDMWAAMIGVSIPVAPWSIGKRSAKVEESEARVRSGERSLADLRNRVAAEVRSVGAKVRSGWDRIGRYRDAVLPQADQAYRSILAAYENDETDFLSLLDGFRMLQMLRMEYIMVVEEYESNVAALERAVGRDLK